MRGNCKSPAVHDLRSWPDWLSLDWLSLYVMPTSSPCGCRGDSSPFRGCRNPFVSLEQSASVSFQANRRSQPMNVLVPLTPKRQRYRFSSIQHAEQTLR